MLINFYCLSILYKCETVSDDAIVSKIEFKHFKKVRCSQYRIRLTYRHYHFFQKVVMDRILLRNRCKFNVKRVNNSGVIHISSRNRPYYIPLKIIGQGAFGVVFTAKVAGNRIVAVKRVQIDPRYVNREYEILKMVKHPNVIQMINFYQSRENNKQYYNYVMEFMPENLHDFSMRFRDQKVFPPILYVKLFGFQLFSGIYYLHSLGICHRDIKPQNILVDCDEGHLKICDLGSAKILKKDEKSVSYIASRFYRAPELILDCPNYTNSIDIWAAGCVLAEVMRAGSPIFLGSSNAHLLSSIVKVIGKPSETDLESFHHNLPFTDTTKQTESIESMLPRHVPPEAIDLLSKIFVYNPTVRYTAKQCMEHPFFDELFANHNFILPSQRPLPSLVR